MIKVAHIEHTLIAYPSEWEGRLTDGTYFYIRYRGARLRIGFGETVWQAVGQACSAAPALEKNLSDQPLDGFIEWADVDPHFTEALARLTEGSNAHP
jgi:hypothetical protein